VRPCIQPRYIPGTIGCAISYGLEFLIIVTWRIVLVLRNRRRDKLLREQGLTEEIRIAKAKMLGEQDYTDFENPYVSLSSPFLLFSSVDMGLFKSNTDYLSSGTPCNRL